jgi:hypothetical protein
LIVGHICVGKQVLEDRSPLGRLFKGEKSFAGDEAVFNGLLPGRAAFALADDDPDAIVAQVECLPRSLNAVAENRHDFILQHFLRPTQGKFLGGHHIFPHPAEIDFCHVLLLFNMNGPDTPVPEKGP